jgi:hypothetical protein
MFRLTKLKPPQGWNAVAWELAIVTLGVLLALSAQEWAESRAMHGKVEASKAAIRDELAEHYGYAVEFRTVYPCVQAQLHGLRDRVVSSGPVLEPVPTYTEQNFKFVLRLPSKVSPTYAWDAAVNDGLIQRFDPSFRRQLAGHYAQIADMQRLIAANDLAAAGLAALTQRLPMDATIRYGIVKEIEEFNGRLDALDLVYGQEIENVQTVEMLPPAEEARAATERYGTYQFCKAHDLPMRSFEEAMQAVPN